MSESGYVDKATNMAVVVSNNWQYSKLVDFMSGNAIYYYFAVKLKKIKK